MKAFPFSRFIVNDKSMEPSFCDGDHVMTFNWMKPKKNSVVVFQSGKEFLIKRVRRVEEDWYVCSGDNLKYSKANYQVTLKNIVGKVVLKY